MSKKKGLVESVKEAARAAFDPDMARYEIDQMQAVDPTVTGYGESPVTSLLRDVNTLNNLSALKDSGTRREWSTGSRRDASVNKGRWDLLPMFGLFEASRQMEDGMQKYGSRNWEKGQPLSVYADSALRHLAWHIAGFRDEPHMRAAAWNILCYLDTAARINLGLLPNGLDDMPQALPSSLPPPSTTQKVEG